MKPTNEIQVCPYTGLRSFTEDESLYFKGRDEQIDQVAALLERNKFLMLTGASGEGKSSLIFAGLIPNARAGFFKAKYGNWMTLSFRPERTPVKNMAQAVAETFAIPLSTAETELRRGYSSLINLYTDSSFYTDENDPGWQELSDAERKARTRKGANLLIMIDQFEEFFTNPENYSKESPSHESQVVVNLALETARIALQKNLPVYVVCTMRSDYIGQCAAFRGLPEYIGFSQFFVPRLKREEIKQVIEEPALLSGNRITGRLVERLVYDLADGIDQLPILQHALRQVWIAADQGNAEMDLIHYAMVGGMPIDDLPDADHAQYKEWFSTLPEKQQNLYAEPGLSKIIEIHASRLYDSAWEYYNTTHKSKPVTQRDAKRIIALAFACLTKIDDSRAVRNRMTLQEITRIINRDHLTVDVVGGVIDIFRESTNSFIRPYTPEGDAKPLSPDVVLDITHESLIRNWGLLNKWAAQEYEFYTTFLDFRKQLTRWKDSNKSSGFLLPLGPLTFFEAWYERAAPNAWWIDRYSDTRTDSDQSIKESQNVLAETNEFIRRSAAKVRLSRAFIRYGAQRIAVVLVAVAMVLLSGFYWYDAERKTNRSIQALAVTKSHELMQSKEVSSGAKAHYLLVEERLAKGSLLAYLKSITNKKEQLGLSLAVYRRLVYYDRFAKLPFRREIIDLVAQLSRQYQWKEENRAQAAFLLEQRNQFLFLLAYDDYYNPALHLQDEVIHAVSHEQFSLTRWFLTHPGPYSPTTPSEMNIGLHFWLTFGKPAPESIDSLIKMASPFGDSTARKVFDAYYVKGSLENNGRLASNYSGGYHTFATLYAAAGDVDNVIRIYQTLPESYFRTTLFNNYTNVLGFMYQYQHIVEAEQVLAWMANQYPTDDQLTVYRNTVLRSGYMPVVYGSNLEKNYLRSNNGYFHVNLAFSDRKQFFALASAYEQRVKAVKNPDERNFLLAMHYKRIAVLYHRYLTDRQMPVNKEELDKLLDVSWAHYLQVSEAYLNESVSITYRYFADGVRNRQYPRRQVFLYPDYRDGWFAGKFNTDLVMEYCNRKGLLAKYFDSREGVELIHDWLSTAHEVFPPRPIGAESPGAIQYDYPLPDKTITDAFDFASHASAAPYFDKNLPALIMANRHFKRGEVEEAMKWFHQLDKATLKTSEDKYEYLNVAYFANAVIDLLAYLAQNGFENEAMQMIAMYQPPQKTLCYAVVANALYDTYKPSTFTFLDSANKNMKRVDFNVEYIDARPNLLYILGRVGGEQVNAMSNTIIRDLFEVQKADGVVSSILGTATEGNYYTAMTAMPTTLTDDQELACYSAILLQVARNQSEETGWDGMDEVVFGSLDYNAFGAL